MKLGVSQSPVQSDDAVNIHPSRAVSYATVAALLAGEAGCLAGEAYADSAQARRCVQSDLCSIVAPCDPVRTSRPRCSDGALVVAAVAVAAAGRRRARVDSVRDFVLLVPRAGDVFL